jgi:hypothetical protein
VRIIRRLEDNIKTDLEEIVYKVEDRFHLAQDRDQWRALVNTEMNLQVPQNVGNFLTGRVTDTLSRWTMLHGVSTVKVK